MKSVKAVVTVSRRLLQSTAPLNVNDTLVSFGSLISIFKTNVGGSFLALVSFPKPLHHSVRGWIKHFLRVDSSAVRYIMHPSTS